MGFLADVTRAPKDSDITGAYYRLLRVENHYPIEGGVTVPKSTIIAEYYKDKASRDAGGVANAIGHVGIETSGTVTTATDGYAKLANDMGIVGTEV